MTTSAYDALVQRLRKSGQAPAKALVDQQPDGGAHVRADLQLDLLEATTAARAANAPSLDVYADTLVIPAGATVGVTGALQRITIVARRLIVGDGSRIVLNHADGIGRAALRLIVAERQGPLRIISNQKGQTNPDYDLSDLDTPHAMPRFVNFMFRNGAAGVRTTVVPVGLLARGEPLHQTLAAAVTVGAGALAADDADPRMTEIAHGVLGWVASWAGLQNDIAELARIAERIKSIAPEHKGGRRIMPIPPRTAAAYLRLAETRRSLAGSIEMDRKFLEQSGDIAEIARTFVAANIRRDDQDKKLIDQEIDVLLKVEPQLKAALAAAARSLRQHQFQQELDRIHLDLQIELDKIDKIVKASFDIAVGLLSLGASIAAICLGVPADPSASGKKNIDGVKGLIETVQDNVNMGDGLKMADHLHNLAFLFKLPFTFIWEHKGDMGDSFKELIAAGVKIKGAAGQIRGGGGFHADLDDIVEALNTALRDLAGKPNALAAKAAWDALELETVNQLDRVINDAEVVGGIKDAAVDYKSSVQKAAVYGRLMAEHQAAIDANQRALAARLLQRCGQLSKTKELENLQQTIVNREALKAHIRAETDLRMEAAGRSFFAACYGLRRAQYYETYSLPRTALAIPADATAMATIYSSVSTDSADARGPGGRVKFTRTVEVDDPETLAQLAAGDEAGVTLTLGPKALDLERFAVIRLTTARMRLSPPAAPGAKVGVEITSGTSFMDRHAGDDLEFHGPAAVIPYEYRGETVETQVTFDQIPPPPFATWLVRITANGGVKQPKSLTIELEGSGVQ